MMKLKYFFQMMLVALTVCLTACSGSSGTDDATERQPNTVMPLTLTFAVPSDGTTSNAKTRAEVPDPGEDTNDKNDWDRLTVIIAYKTKTQSLNIVDDDPGLMVYYDTFTKEQFDKTLTEDVAATYGTLSKADANGYRQYTRYVPLGTCRVYGVVYSAGQGLYLENLLSSMANDGADKTTAVEALQISNEYATTDGTMDISKFISVGTGYARKLDTTGALTDNKDITVAFKDETTDNSVENKEYWRMDIRRLATKLDIQWDAKGIYEKGTYKNVTVSDFTFDGTSSSASSAVEGSGYGRLFPTLQSEDVEAIGGKKTFINTSEISKRNGRQYHYLFPDGSKSAKVTFTIDSELAADAEAGTTATSTTKKYTFDLKSQAPLKSATWYKINATISGTTFGTEGTTEVTIDKFN